MVLKFCANLNFLFTENSANYLAKYIAAKAAGFQGVEGGYPENVPIEDVLQVQAETGLKQVLINLKAGNNPMFQFGSASIPGANIEFQNLFNDTVQVAKKLNCKKIHIMAGKVTKNETYDKHYETYITNLEYASKILETENMIGVIEPINKYALPDYFLNNYETALNAIKHINKPNIRLMIDIFHLQHIRGDITNSFKELMPYTGHVQIAQVPHRHEPNIPGELNFTYIFQALEATGYNDWIGCEYKPKTDTIDGLKWISEFGYQL